MDSDDIQSLKACVGPGCICAPVLDILPAESGEDSYGLSVRFPEMASVGSSHNRPTSAEDHEEALLLGCPPIGRLDESILCCHIQKEQEGLISPASKAEACRPSSVRREEAPLDGEDRSEIMCQKEMACWIPIWPAQPRILFPAISKEQTDCPHSAGHCDTPRQSLLRYSYSQIGTVTSARTKSVRN